MYIYLIAFILGASVASFLNVVAKSLPINQNWISRRSACSNCQKTLSPRELIPILSYIFQLGRCTSCQAKIPPIYLLAEITGGILFITPLFLFPSSYLVQAWIFFSLLLTVTLTDLYWQLIPNKILIAFGIPLFLLRPSIAGAIIGFLFFYGTSLLGKLLFKKETIGGGDIKLYLVIGLVLGVYSLFLSITISSAIALAYILVFAKDKSKPIPFAPFIALGSIIAYFLSLYN